MAKTESFDLSDGRPIRSPGAILNAMKLTKKELIAEKISLLLLSLDQNDLDDWVTFDTVANDAASMAYRANKAIEDSSWWEIPGKPHWNDRMARLRAKMGKGK
jgi:hypothetical protein